jgi:hypothetical protein
MQSLLRFIVAVCLGALGRRKARDYKDIIPTLTKGEAGFTVTIPAKSAGTVLTVVLDTGHSISCKRFFPTNEWSFEWNEFGTEGNPDRHPSEACAATVEIQTGNRKCVMHHALDVERYDDSQ